MLSGSNRKRRWKERRPTIYQSSDESSSTSARSGLPPLISRSSFAHSEGRSSIGLGIFPSFTSFTSVLSFLSIGPITSVSHRCTLPEPGLGQYDGPFEPLAVLKGHGHSRTVDATEGGSRLQQRPAW